MRVCAQSKYLTENAFDVSGEMVTVSTFITDILRCVNCTENVAPSLEK